MNHILKNLVGIFLCLCGFVVLLFVFSKLSGINLIWINGDKPRQTSSVDMLNQSPEEVSKIGSTVQWRPDSSEVFEDPGGPLKSLIASYYTKALQALSHTIETNEYSRVESFFCAEAAIAIKESIVKKEIFEGVHNIVSSDKVKLVSLSNELQFLFLAANRRFATLKDYSHKYLLIIEDESGEFRTILREEQLSINMILRGGRWRISQLIRENSININLSHKFDQNIINKKIGDKSIRGINYYPKNTPWDTFWTDFDPKIIKADQLVMKNLGLDSVRIFLPTKLFGFSKPEDIYLERLSKFMELSSENEIKVMITLFDGISYNYSDWGLLLSSLKYIIPEFKNHKALLGWDIKNEADLDFELVGKKNVLVLLRILINEIYSLDPQAVTTVGWANIEAADNLSDILSLLTFHYYSDIESFEQDFIKFKSNHFGKKIMVTEFGMHSFDSWYYPFSKTKDQQTWYLYKLIDVMDRVGLDGWMVWTLYDFESIPEWVTPKHRLWDLGRQKNMGIIDYSGIPKEITKYLKDVDFTIKKPNLFKSYVLRKYNILILVPIIMLLLLFCFVILANKIDDYILSRVKSIQPVEDEIFEVIYDPKKPS